MKYAIFAVSVWCAAVMAAPAQLKARAPGDKGSYIVDGLGSRKQEVLNAGGNTLDIAIAMLESDHMTTDYPYGDNKSNDSANFGIFKQNWGMLRVCASQFRGQSEAEFNDGAILNNDLKADLLARSDCVSYYGTDKWFAGHRNGASGLSNPNTDDINTYKNAVYWIQQQIDSDSKYKSDDTRFWVDVTPI